MDKFKILVTALGLVICTQAAYAVNTRDEITGVSTGGISAGTFSAYTTDAVKEGDSPTFGNITAETITLTEANSINVPSGGRVNFGVSNYIFESSGFLGLSDKITLTPSKIRLNVDVEGASDGHPVIKHSFGGPTSPLWTTSNDDTGFSSRTDSEKAFITSGGVNSASFDVHTTTLYPSGPNPVKIDDTGVIQTTGAVKASVFSPYSTTTAAALTLTGADTAWNCDITSNDVTFTLYSSGPSTQGNSVEVAVTKPSGSNTCFVAAHGNQTVRSGSVAFTSHSGMDADGEAFKYYDTGRGYFMIHGGY
jgi:hypothetical protein